MSAPDVVVVVNSLTDATVDGSPSGTVVDILANNPSHPTIRARMLDALVAWDSARVDVAQTREDALNAYIGALKAQIVGLGETPISQE
jgi:hypothetical protein